MPGCLLVQPANPAALLIANPPCLLQIRHDGYGMVWVKTQRAGISDIHNVNPTINLQHWGYIDDSSLLC
jgi:hypothetical protein